jgi:hypothetical protein
LGKIKNGKIPNFLQGNTLAESQNYSASRFQSSENLRTIGWREQEVPSSPTGAEGNPREPARVQRYAVGTKGEGFGILLIENLESDEVPPGDHKGDYRVVYQAKDQSGDEEPLYDIGIEVNTYIPIELENGYFDNLKDAEAYAEKIIEDDRKLEELIGDKIEYST